jgi:hypothetical protein
MKKFTIILTVLFAMTITTNAQIPNGGFENWTTIGSYEDPTGWASTNSYSTGSFYAITKSTDHYPATVGNYSVRIENNISLLPNFSGRGVVMTGDTLDPHPTFPITGHPTSLTGYYKFAPQNGDTMAIVIELYLNGVRVFDKDPSFISNATTSGWTSFNISFPTYTIADSGHIYLASYAAADASSMPLGNSILYVDNLNFDNLITSVAQIPNNGFELWTSFGSYSNPDSGWVTNNSYSAGTYYPVTKSTDHYPASVGSFSVRMENNISFPGTTAEKYGYTATALYPGYNGPFFPIIGHPNSLCGYYKFAPQNNDTMTIMAALYYNGAIVSTAVLNSTTTATDWTSFNIPFPAYSIADSAQIGLCAYYDVFGIFPSGPYGNSVLYVDNISFDNLISSVSESPSKNNGVNFYPNPASNVVSLNFTNTQNEDIGINIYSILGVLVRSEILKQNNKQINVSDLSNGVYMVIIKSKDLTETKKLIIQR